MKKWDSLIEMLSELNEKNNYLVLRNYELYTANKLFDGHDDIDLLCDDRNKIFQTIQAKKIDIRDDIHVVVNITGKNVRVDIRCVGDSYFDTAWEENMLNTRIMYKNSFYVMNDENYFYSILYHEFFHKRKLREDYFQRLLSLSYNLEIEFNERNLKDLLKEYMQKKGYKVTGYISL